MYSVIRWPGETVSEQSYVTCQPCQQRLSLGDECQHLAFADDGVHAKTDGEITISAFLIDVGEGRYIQGPIA